MKGKKGGRYYKRGGRWWIAYFNGQKEFRTSVGRYADEKQAKTMLETEMKKVAAAEIGNQIYIPPKKKSVTEILDAFESEYILLDKFHAQTASEVKFVRERFGSMSCKQITEDVLRHWQLEMREAGAANGSINKKVGVLLKAMKLAKLPAPNVPKLSTIGTTRQGFFEAHELRRVLTLLPDYLADAVLCLHLTGWRAGEVMGKKKLFVVNGERFHRFVSGLTWANIDGAMLTLEERKSKNRQRRKCPVSGELASLLERRRKLQAGDLIFHRGDGTPIGDYHHIWKRAVKLAGCEGRVVHDLRRTRVRALTRAGTPETVCMKLTGHKTRKVFDAYNISSEHDLISAQERTEVYLQAEAEKQLKQLSTAVQ
ncbi:MAG: tyrosine-type recombinase/integrase [Terriglobales bacterium]